jgi:hypothetical protein
MMLVYVIASTELGILRDGRSNLRYNGSSFEQGIACLPDRQASRHLSFHRRCSQ